MMFNSFSPTFSLVDSNGRQVTEKDYRGQSAIVFFGFTKCAVVCPRALDRLSSALKALGPDSKQTRVLYISVDPERDTPEIMGKFLSGRGIQFVGLTGTKEQVDQAKKAFRVFSQKKLESDAPGGYVVAHSGITFLLGPDGRLLDHFNDSLGLEEATVRIRKSLILNNARSLESEYVSDGWPSRRVGSVTEPSIVEGKEALGRLSKEHVASIRHIANLSRQLKGDWSNMMGPTDLNDGFGAYRFQIAYGTFALALAHFHRLQAAPGYFKPTMERLIDKMLHPDVWMYWRDASTGGGVGETPRREAHTNPVDKDNIMYSAYLQCMVMLYQMLFNDDRYEKPGSLTLQYDPYLWGPKGGFKWEYDANSLNDIIYWQMVESGYLGVACEPDCVFQICNQPPIIAFRINDELRGGNTAKEVTDGYLKAWSEFGQLDAQGGYNLYVGKHNNRVVPSPGPGMDAWCATLMNSWNSEYVMENYEHQRDRFLVRHSDGTASVKVVVPDGLSENTTGLMKQGEFGWTVALAKEVGDWDTLDMLLAYADKTFRPMYRDGGLLYPRRDEVYDENGKYVMSSPIQSNALIPLARLNVKHGFKRLYESPWSPKNNAHYYEPALTAVDECIDIYRAVYLAEDKKMLFDLAVYQNGSQGPVTLSRALGRGNWTLRQDGVKVAWGDSESLTGTTMNEAVRQEGGDLIITIRTTEVTSFVLEF
ncbi:SCO2- involved in stability of Cox1p and Cox2p [Fusarium albosuccineum]|uniref:SCO2- involved in stability of Cox1p and Cox2p n=1 Tax=Fusarium albosuccineum TaxID=1237068 RepID=A0A8H4P1K9_9HYPO|nr:SCO2- involved in stability of Cox1p and Cox2p [Fusarium albosuccineum]